MAKAKTPETETAAPANEKKPRPQNSRLKPLGSGLLTPEEEFAIRSKGGKAACEKRWHKQETLAMGEVLSNLLSKGMKKGEVTPVDEVESIADLDTLNPSGKSYIWLMELKRYLATGDKESRDFVYRAVKEYETEKSIQEMVERLTESGVQINADKLALLNALQKQHMDRLLLVGVAASMGIEVPDLSGEKDKKNEEAAPGGVHIHLTRGEKPAGDGAKATHVTVGVDPDAGDEA